MINKAMERKINNGAAINIADRPKTKDGDYILDYRYGRIAEDGGVDFCDSKLESWIWSIGRSLGPCEVEMADGEKRTFPHGTVIASLSAKFYQAEKDGWECIWLR